MTSCGKKRDYMQLNLRLKDPFTGSCLDELRKMEEGWGGNGKGSGGTIVHSFPTDDMRIYSVFSLLLMVDPVQSQNMNFVLKFDKEFLRQISKNVVDPYMEVFLDLNGGGSPSISVKSKEAAISEFVHNPSKDTLLINSDVPLTKSVLEQFVGESSFMSLCITISSKSCGSGANQKSYSDFILQNLYNMDDAMKDLTIMARNGVEIKCHRVILAAQSLVFASMLSPECGMKEAQMGKVELEYTQEAIAEFVKFVYGTGLDEGSISPELAIELLQLAHKYEVKELEGTLLNILSKKKMDWYSSVDNLMELYYFVRGIDNLGVLRAHALTELSQLPADRIMSSDYFNKLEIDEGKKFFGILYDWKGCKFFDW